MKMKLLLVLSFLVSGMVHGQQQTKEYYANCRKEVDQQELEKKQNPGKAMIKNPTATECQAWQNVAALNGGSLSEFEPETKRTADQRHVCINKAAFTMDYDACATTAKYYDAIIIAEQAMFLEQKVRVDMNNKKLQDDVARRTVTGDGNNATYDAAVSANKQTRNLNIEQAAVYTTAVTALGTALWKWPGTSLEKLQKVCAKKTLKPGIYERAEDKVKQCDGALEYTYGTNRRNLLANQDAKAGFIMSLTEFIAKGVRAGIAASQFENIAKQMEKGKQQYEDDIVMMDKCIYAPMDPACRGPGTRVFGDPSGPGSFNLGDGQTNAFNVGDGEDTTFGDIGDPTDIKTPESIADITNPFKDEAAAANDILNPAGAASAPAPGAPGGGGGGGGLGGGGSASLGDDLEGANKNGDKDPEIKATEADGKYADGGKTGFKSMQGRDSKEDANPFASLFDSKTSGGVEEDRSMASAEIDGPASGLFQKISTRYRKITEADRLNSNNLE